MREFVSFAALEVRLQAEGGQADRAMELDLLLALAVVRTYRAERGQWTSELPPLHPEHPVLRPTSVRMQVGSGDTRVLDLEEAQAEAVMGFTNPWEGGEVRLVPLTAVP